MKILINALDDEEIILDWLKDLFPHDLYDLKLFKDARLFIQAFTKTTDLIITDAKVDGYDLHKTLRDFKQINKGVFIIIISGHVNEDFLLPLFPLGVNYVIPKKGIDNEWLNDVKEAVNELLPRMLHRAQLLEA